MYCRRLPARTASPTSTRAVERATAALLAGPAAGRPLGLRARGRRHHPGRIRAADALSRRADRSRAGAQDRRLSARASRATHGGWPLFHGGAFDISASVKAYFALKMIGDRPDAPHMRARARGDPRAAAARREQRLHPHPARALRRAAVARGAGDAGRDHAAAALVPVPSRQDLVLGAHGDRAAAGAAWRCKPRARNPRGVAHRTSCSSRRRTTSGAAAKAPHQNRVWCAVFRGIDRVLRAVEPLFPKRDAQARDRQARSPSSPSGSTARTGSARFSRRWPTRVMMFDALGYPPDHPRPRHRARRRSRSCWSSRTDEAYCQPCVSPVWDTALAGHALLEAGDGDGVARRASAGSTGSSRCRCSTSRGDWAVQRPDVRPGGWAFQYANPHYPDLDDTAVVVHGAWTARATAATALSRRAIARGARMGRRACRAATAAGAPSTPTTPTTI